MLPRVHDRDTRRVGDEQRGDKSSVENPEQRGGENLYEPGDDSPGAERKAGGGKPSSTKKRRIM